MWKTLQSGTLKITCIHIGLSLTAFLELFCCKFIHSIIYNTQYLYIYICLLQLMWCFYLYDALGISSRTDALLNKLNWLTSFQTHPPTMRSCLYLCSWCCRLGLVSDLLHRHTVFPLVWPDTDCCSLRCTHDMHSSLWTNTHECTRHFPPDVWTNVDKGLSRRPISVGSPPRYLAAAEHRTCGSQRWAAARCAAEWRCRLLCPAWKCCRCGTRSRTGSVCSGTGRRRGSAPDLRTPSGWMWGKQKDGNRDVI